MKNAKQLLNEYALLAEEILVLFSVDEKKAAKKLEELKKLLGEKQTIEKEAEEIFLPCVYNALATINSALDEKTRNAQLIACITEAKEEMRAISDIL